MILKLFKKDDKAEISVSRLIGVAVMIFVGVALLPTIIVFVSAAQNASGGSTATIVGLITVLYALGLAVAAIYWVVHDV